MSRTTVAMPQTFGTIMQSRTSRHQVWTGPMKFQTGPTGRSDWTGPQTGSLGLDGLGLD